jgi:hypothetical protein
LAELGHTQGSGRGFVRQIGERSQVEQGVDELDDRAVLRRFVGDAVNIAVGGDDDRRDPGTLVERIAFRIKRANAGLGVVKESIGLVVGDDDGALRPVGALGDGVDRIGEQRFADLGIGVARMVVVAGEIRLDGRTGGARSQAIKVAVAAT